ncbi:MAG: glycosyltransferase [Aurantimicrobium sp.]|nr:glycosyltransferase [Aurantimicrobium sp.]
MTMSQRNREDSAQGSQSDTTVVMALFNGGELTRVAVDSVLAQTRPPRELIIVDDGSTDDSVAIVERFLAQRASSVPVRFISQPNSGQGAARNAGVAAATTEFIAFIDQDDTWPPDHIEILSEHLVNDERLGWVYSDFCQIDRAGVVVRGNVLAETKYAQPADNVLSFLGQDLFMLPSASLIRTRAFTSAGGFDTQFRGYEDDDLFISMLDAGWAFAFEPRPVTNYRVHSGNTSRNASFLKSREKFFDKYQDELATNRESRALFTAALSDRMTRAFLMDAISMQKGGASAEYKAELFRVARKIFSSLGLTPKRRAVLLAIRSRFFLRFLLFVWFRSNPTARANHNEIF